MAGDNLTIILFLIGLGVTFGIAALSLADWKHPVIIKGLFILAIILLIGGFAWPWMKNIFPSFEVGLMKIAYSPIAWFSIIMFFCAFFLFVTKGSFRIPPRRIPTRCKLRFIQGSLNPENLDQSNIWVWYALRHEFTIINNAPNTSPNTYVMYQWTLFLLFEKPVAIKQMIVDGGGAILPTAEVKNVSSRHAIIHINGDLGNNIVDIRAKV